MAFLYMAEFFLIHVRSMKITFFWKARNEKLSWVLLCIWPSVLKVLGLEICISFWFDLLICLDVNKLGLKNMSYDGVSGFLGVQFQLIHWNFLVFFRNKIQTMTKIPYNVRKNNFTFFIVQRAYKKSSPDNIKLDMISINKWPT